MAEKSRWKQNLEDEIKKISPEKRNEIKRKAYAGKALTNKSDQAANYLYNQFKNESTALAKNLKAENTSSGKLMSEYESLNKKKRKSVEEGTKEKTMKPIVDLGMGELDYNALKPAGIPSLPSDKALYGEDSKAPTMTAKQQMEYDERVRRSDPEYVKSEMARTERVMKNRIKAGLDVTAQIKYMKQLKSYK
jgi:hypothetical protein